MLNGTSTSLSPCDIVSSNSIEGSLIRIETKRLLIRRFVPEDWPDLHDYLSDPLVVRFEPYEVFTEEESRAEALRRSTDESFWAVCLKENRKLIGNLYFSRKDSGTYELGYVFHRRYQGQGYASEAARSLLDSAFREWGVRRIVATCNPENEKSWRLLERLSMRREGHLRQNIWFRTDAAGNPLKQDTYEYAVLATEWLGLRES